MVRRMSENDYIWFIFILYILKKRGSMSFKLPNWESSDTQVMFWDTESSQMLRHLLHGIKWVIVTPEALFHSKNPTSAGLGQYWVDTISWGLILPLMYEAPAETSEDHLHALWNTHTHNSSVFFQYLKNKQKKHHFLNIISVYCRMSKKEGHKMPCPVSLDDLFKIFR